MRVLLFSSLFPSTARPRHGIFVETRLRHLIRDCGVDARVIAPVPWFPFRAEVFGRYAREAATPRRAVRDNGVPVAHPRYAMVPKIGVPFQPASMARAAMADLRAWRRGGWVPDLIDAHYFYPDGVAAGLLADTLGVPFVVTARGTDVNVLGKMPASARRIAWAADRAAAVIAVSARLKDALVELGVEPSKVTVLRNGVDIEMFRPEDRAEARRRLGLPENTRLAACVGNLLPEKGQALAIEALVHLPDLHLAIVGDGPTRQELASQARRLGVEDRVSFIPTLPQSDLRHLYSSLDVLLLPSTREGWPNVVLEALACGTPVAAVDVGAVGDMLTDPRVGRIAPAREPRAFATAIGETLAGAGTRTDIRDHAARFDWATISRGQMEVFSRALGAADHSGADRAGAAGGA